MLEPLIVVSKCYGMYSMGNIFFSKHIGWGEYHFPMYPNPYTNQYNVNITTTKQVFVLGVWAILYVQCYYSGAFDGRSATCENESYAIGLCASSGTLDCNGFSSELRCCRQSANETITSNDVESANSGNIFCNY